MKPKNILITGPPGCGKSTLLEKLIQKIPQPLTGFVTREIRRKGKRTGFSIRTVDGQEGILAHRESKSQWRVGRYGVDLEEMDRVAVPAMIPSHPDQVVVIDEIGKMECLSSRFRDTLLRILDSPNRVIGSIAQKGSPFMDSIKKRPDVMLISISEKNRNSLGSTLLNEFFKN